MNYNLGVLSVQIEEYFPFGKQRFFFEDMIESYQEEDLKVLFFSPLDWDGTDIVHGFEYIDDQWKRVKASIPQLIYDRAFSKSEEEKNIIEKCRIGLEQNGHCFLNPLDMANMLNDKIGFHQFLLGHEIPTLGTHQIQSDSITEQDLSFTNKRIFLKPNFGSKGEGIYVIEKLLDGFNLIDRIGNSVFYQSLEKLNLFIKNENLDLKRYFLQEEASLESLNNSPFDIRVLVQNYGHEYKITGKGVRIGQLNAVTANLNSGGKAIAVEELSDFMISAFDRTIEDEIYNIEEICLTSSRLLEHKFGAFVEIGYDILITHEGPIIIEANAKPSRWLFNVIADDKISQGESAEKFLELRNETVKVPLIYASFLNHKLWNNDSHLSD